MFEAVIHDWRMFRIFSRYDKTVQKSSGTQSISLNMVRWIFFCTLKFFSQGLYNFSMKRKSKRWQRGRQLWVLHERIQYNPYIYSKGNLWLFVSTSFRYWGYSDLNMQTHLHCRQWTHSCAPIERITINSLIKIRTFDGKTRSQPSIITRITKIMSLDKIKKATYANRFCTCFKLRKGYYVQPTAAI